MWKKLVMIFVGIFAFCIFSNVYGYTYYQLKGSGITINANVGTGTVVSGGFKSKYYDERETNGYYKELIGPITRDGRKDGDAVDVFKIDPTDWDKDPPFDYISKAYDIVSTDDKNSGYFQYVLLYNILREIENRISVGYNDAEDLELYKSILTEVKEADVYKNYNDIPGCVADVSYKNLADPLAQIAYPAWRESVMAKVTRYQRKVRVENDVINEKIDGLFDKIISYAGAVRAKVEKATPYVPAISNTSDSDNQNSIGSVESAYGNDSNSWWVAARDFFVKGKNSSSVATGADALIDNLSDMIFTIGNMIFIIVTSVLGVKYIFGAAEAKAQIKDSLLTLVVAALFFYGWSAISNMLNIATLFQADSYETAATKIYNTVLFIVNLLAICGIIWIGVKYMLSSAEGKAEIKTSWVPVILGIVMVYATVWFLTTVIQVVF